MDDIQKEIEREDEIVRNAQQKEEEVRAKIIKDYGLDPTDNAALIDQLTKDKLTDMKNFGELVGQKRKQREARIAAEEALKGKKETPPAPTAPPAQTLTREEIEQIADRKADEKLAERELKALSLPETLEKEIREFAKTSGKLVTDVVREGYFHFKIEEHRTAKKAEEAALSRTNNAAPGQTTLEDLSKGLDLNTEEGRAEWVKRKEAQGKKQ